MENNFRLSDINLLVNQLWGSKAALKNWFNDNAIDPKWNLVKKEYILVKKVPNLKLSNKLVLPESEEASQEGMKANMANFLLCAYITDPVEGSYVTPVLALVKRYEGEISLTNDWYIVPRNAIYLTAKIS